MIVVGLSHKTAPVELRERLSLSGAQVEAVLADLKASPGCSELTVLSTCNRTEFYFSDDDPERAKDWCCRFFGSKMSAEEFEKHMYLKSDREAIRHLFKVVSGLDSMVLGENEITKQVKDAYQLAHRHGLTGKVLNVLFQRALHTGKLVRTHTGIGHGGLSVGSIAVSLAEKIFGSLHESSVLMFGAGKMAEVSARYLLGRNVKELWVANRTLENAEALAQKFGGQAFTLDQGMGLLPQADVVITSMSAPNVLLTESVILEAMNRRQHRSLFLIDIAVPRNIDERVHQMDNVYLYNIDDLQSLASENLKGRQGEFDKAQQIVKEKADEFADWLDSLKAGQERSLKHNTNFMQKSNAG